MTINLDDVTHPKNHYCLVCWARPGEWCRSNTGRKRARKLRVGYSKQHRNRIKSAVLEVRS